MRRASTFALAVAAEPRDGAQYHRRNDERWSLMSVNVAAELVGFDPLGRAFQQNPYPFFEAMRAASPLWTDPATGLGFVTRHDLVARMLRDTETFSSAIGATPNEPPPAEVAEQVAAIKSQGWSVRRRC